MGGEMRPGIVHRLDKETSGLIVVAKNDEAHRKLAEQFARRQVKKTYVALVHGWPKKDHGTISASISRDRVRRIRMTTRGSGGREAVSHYTRGAPPGHRFRQVRAGRSEDRYRTDPPDPRAHGFSGASGRGGRTLWRTARNASQARPSDRRGRSHFPSPQFSARGATGTGASTDRPTHRPAEPVAGGTCRLF